SNPTASIETTLLYEVLQQAQQARDEAEAAANAAAASAATISPTKQAQWDQAFAERNRWDGSSAGLNASAGRASLGLGTASQANVVSSATDTTTGAATIVGWMGAGARSISIDSGGSLSTNQVSGFYNYTNHNLPIATAVGGITVQTLATTEYTVSFLGRNGRFFGVTRENGNQSS